MRVLLTSNASYAPPKGGSTRSNLVWLSHLARAGHECVVVSSIATSSTPDTTTVDAHGITLHSIRDLSLRTPVLGEHIRNFRPDWVLVSSEDLSHVLLREAHAAAPDRLVYLAHTPQFYPFGPASWNPDRQATEIVRGARAIVAIARYTASYIQDHAGIAATVIHPPIYGDGPYARFGSFDRGYLLMVNPSIVKGISIFRALAESFPELPFAALTGWGTTSSDRAGLERLPNVTILAPVASIEEVLSKSRLLLMPSLWYEGFGLVAMEAMLRGLPVISSDAGGLVEAKQGTGYVVPVRPIERFEPVFDEAHMPKPLPVEQDIEPWKRALISLLNNRDAYTAESDRSREAALRFVTSLRASAFEDLLISLTPSEPAVEAKPPQIGGTRLEQLSPAKRALLMQRLKQRSKS